jgi:hypothetical protein
MILMVKDKLAGFRTIENIGLINIIKNTNIKIVSDSNNTNVVIENLIIR